MSQKGYQNNSYQNVNRNDNLFVSNFYFLQIPLNQKGLANNKQKTQYEYLHDDNIEGQ